MQNITKFEPVFSRNILHYSLIIIFFNNVNFQIVFIQTELEMGQTNYWTYNTETDFGWNKDLKVSSIACY